MGENAAGTTGWAHSFMGRRAFLIGAGAGVVLPQLLAPAQARAAMSGVPADGKLSFEVLRKGSRIGQQDMRFEIDGDNLTVRIDLRITVKVGPLPVYHHFSRVTERWSGGRFVSIESSTNSNEVSRDNVTARRTDDGIYIQPANGKPYTAPADALPLTHWNRFAYQGPVFNPESGQMVRLSVASKTDDTVKLADGSSVRATRWSVKGDGVMDDYYDVQGVWAGLHSRVKDGSFVDYLKL